MPFPAEQEEQDAIVVAKYLAVPANESDSPNFWIATIKFLGKHIKQVPLYLMPQWYKAKVAQEEGKAHQDEAKATATLLDAKGLYEERVAKAAREKAAAEGELAKAEKTREETRAQRIKNDAEDYAKREELAREIWDRIQSSLSTINAKGGTAEIVLPKVEEPKQITGSGNVIAGMATASGIGHVSTNKESIVVTRDIVVPMLEASGVVQVGPLDSQPKAEAASPGNLRGSATGTSRASGKLSAKTVKKRPKKK